jgi:hypothetical protein
LLEFFQKILTESRERGAFFFLNPDRVCGRRVLQWRVLRNRREETVTMGSGDLAGVENCWVYANTFVDAVDHASRSAGMSALSL